MNESTPIFTLSEEISWEEEIEFKRSPCSQTAATALLSEGALGGGLGHSTGEEWLGPQLAGSSAISLLLVSSFACSYVTQSLGVGTAPSSPLPIAPGAELSLSRPEVSLLEHVNEQMCICWLVDVLHLLSSKYFCI